jgi:hypothetical protein
MATVPNDLLDRIRALERQVRELAGRSQTRPALNRVADGTVRIEQGGQLVVAPSGKNFATFTVGQWPDGAFGTVLRRADGTYALTVEGPKEARGTVRIWSRDTAAPDRILVSDDVHSDRFLGRPYIPLQLHPTAAQRTTAADWSIAWTGTGPAHNAVAVIKVSTRAEAGGRVRVRIRNGTAGPAVIGEWEVPAGVWTEHAIERPLHGTEFLDDLGVQIEHRASKDGRAIETRLFSAYTRSTESAAEAPEPPSGQASDTATAPDPRLAAEHGQDDEATTKTDSTKGNGA